jgi:hypothetical protein
MKKAALMLLCLLAVPRVHADDHGAAARRARLLEVVVAEQERNFFGVAARFRLGVDVGRACVMLDSLTRDRTIGGMFYSYGLIGTMLFSRPALPDSLERKIRDAYRTRTMYRGDTENHWVMYYTGMYLAAQTWPGEEGTRWFNGKSSLENFREAEGYLRGWIDVTSRQGQMEFDSPTYMSLFLGAMVVLREFAADPVMQRRADMMVDLLLADFAAEHLHGNFGGAHSRDYPDDITNPLSAPSTLWAWLLFGEPAFEPWDSPRSRPRHRGSWEPTFAALSSYRLPEVLWRMATDRSQPYVHLETKRVRNIIRFGTRRNPPVYKYTYMTNDFVLGSLQGGILQPIQQHTWDVTYASDRPNNTVFSLHPFASGRELAMFFPEEQKFLAAEVDRYHLVYTSPDKWNSSSPYEQVFQHRGTLIALYAIEPGTRQEHVDAFFPKTLDERTIDSSGWVFARAGGTFIAVYPLRPGTWSDESIDWRFRSGDLRNGFVVHVSSAHETGSFGAFCRSVAARPVKVEGMDSTPAVAWTTPAGDRLRFTYGGARLVNGVSVRRDGRLLYYGPFMHSVRGSGVITLKAGREVRVLDFPRAKLRTQ